MTENSGTWEEAESDLTRHRVAVGSPESLVQMVSGEESARDLELYTAYCGTTKQGFGVIRRLGFARCPLMLAVVC